MYQEVESCHVKGGTVGKCHVLVFIERKHHFEKSLLRAFLVSNDRWCCENYECETLRASLSLCTIHRLQDCFAWLRTTSVETCHNSRANGLEVDWGDMTQVRSNFSNYENADTFIWTKYGLVLQLGPKSRWSLTLAPWCTGIIIARGGGRPWDCRMQKQQQ